ncbi:DUF3265 domain-containing protein [Vibrio parahaemolyticus]|nr:DUF3265 domain-containing protein [Vibrio parahaemolyticus]
MTKRSSGTHAAWHFWYALSFCGESGLRRLLYCVAPPLTGRYVHKPGLNKTMLKFLRPCFIGS